MPLPLISARLPSAFQRCITRSTGRPSGAVCPALGAGTDDEAVGAEAAAAVAERAGEGGVAVEGAVDLLQRDEEVVAEAVVLGELHHLPVWRHGAVSPPSSQDPPGPVDRIAGGREPQGPDGRPLWGRHQTGDASERPDVPTFGGGRPTPGSGDTMTVEQLHRLQFALTASFHFIFPPMSLGLGLILVIFGVKSVRTNDPKWRQLSFFWMKIYGLIFAMGIATGLVQEFEFGTNWSVYSRFVGNIFGSLLAAEGIFAFMLEGGFLGPDALRRQPARQPRCGCSPPPWSSSAPLQRHVDRHGQLVDADAGGLRDQGRRPGDQAFMTSFQDVVFTPSFIPRILHTIVASWMVGASLVLSVAACYLLRKRHVELAKTMIRVALPLFTVLGHPPGRRSSAPTRPIEVANQQPEKLAAMEGVYHVGRLRADDHLRLDRTRRPRRPPGLQIPCLLSLLVGQSTDDRRSQGLDAVPAGRLAQRQPGVPGVPPDDQPRDAVHRHRRGSPPAVVSGSASSGTHAVDAVDPGRARSSSPSWPPSRAGGRPSSADSRGSSGSCCAPTTPSRRNVSAGQVCVLASGCSWCSTPWCSSCSSPCSTRRSRHGPPEPPDDEVTRVAARHLRRDLPPPVPRLDRG